MRQYDQITLIYVNTRFYRLLLIYINTSFQDKHQIVKEKNTLKTSPNPPRPILLRSEKLFVATSIVLKSNCRERTVVIPATVVIKGFN